MHITPTHTYKQGYAQQLLLKLFFLKEMHHVALTTRSTETSNVQLRDKQKALDGTGHMKDLDFNDKES